MLKRTFIISTSLAALIGCGDDENTETTPDADATADTGVSVDTSAGDDTTSGVDGTDTGTAEADAAADGDVATALDASDVDDTQIDSPCDPDVSAAEFLELKDSVADASWTPGEADGTATLDASLGGPAGAAESAWVYVDLVNGELLELTDVEAYESDAWTLAFKRTEIRLNGGASGAGAWLTARIEGTTFDDATAGRDADWRGDDFIDPDTCEVITEGRGTAATAFGIWYDYDPATHTVSAPEGVVYALYNASSHVALKFEITNYDGGVYDLRWGAL